MPFSSKPPGPSAEDLRRYHECRSRERDQGEEQRVEDRPNHAERNGHEKGRYHRSREEGQDVVDPLAVVDDHGV